MARTPIADPPKDQGLKDPILSRTSDLFGTVNVYAPKSDPQHWGELPWTLTTETDAGGNPPGLYAKLKAKYVSEVFERPHFLQEYHKFGKPDKPDWRDDL